MLLSILFMIGFILLGVVFMYRAASGRLKSKKAQSWPLVKGRVVSSEVLEERFRSATGKATIAFVPVVSYEYTVNGTTYTGSVVIFGETTYDYITASRICEKYTPESEPNVYYNPADPQDSVLLPQATEGLRSLIPGIFFIITGIIIGVMGFLFPN
ncbi:MAG TPA: DUF3592 domain-containing protein [Anaerolineaceae bacterium]|nr:DUF3592 domain-containing protein [Anaerolineaceae bacterium]